MLLWKICYLTRLDWSHIVFGLLRSHGKILAHYYIGSVVFKLNFYYKQWYSAAWWLTITSVIRISVVFFFTRFWHCPACCWRRWVHLRHILHSLKTWPLSANYFCQVNWAFTLKSYEKNTRYCWINCEYMWRKFRYKLHQHTGRMLI